MERDVVSTRFRAPLRSGGTDREEALRVAFVGTFPPARCGLATVTESMLRSISQRLLTAAVPWKAQGTDNSGAWGMCRATDRATYGACSGKGTVMSAPVELEGSVHQADLERLVAGDHHDPHQILGPHLEKDGDGRVRVVIRGWRPDAAGMAVLSDGARIEMRRIQAAGVFAGVLEADAVPAYRLESTDRNGTTTSFDDPYGCWPTLGEMDLHLLGEGRHEGLWRHLGAIVRVHQGLSGTSFAVWAPSARSVRVVGDFNGWDGRVHPMRVLGSSGVWEIFLPGVGPGARYKYEVVSQGGRLSLRADPFALAAEVPPATASIVTRSTHESSSPHLPAVLRGRTRHPRRHSLQTHPLVYQPRQVHRSFAGSLATAPVAPWSGWPG